MLKDLVVNLSPAGSSDPAADYALSVAATFEAHIAGVAFAFEPIIPVTAMGGVASDIIDSAIAENERTAKAALDRFESAAKKRGVSAETRSITAILADAADQLGRIARRFDLCVVPQADPEKPGPEDLFVQSVLFASGRPLLIVPYIQKAAIKLDHVLCCWDGSQTSARAIADAMPFLQKAKTIDLFIVATDKVRRNEISGADMAQHLARHGFKINVEQVVAKDIDVASAILSYAADSSADFLVMGGYGHSRWREFVLGGATRGILSAMTVPTLMSH